jgi:hypothetical protein
MTPGTLLRNAVPKRGIMKTLFLIVIVMVTLNSSALSQTPSDTTDGWLNGRGWDTLNRVDKMQFLSGLYEGIRILADDLDAALPNQRKLITEKMMAYVVRQKLSDLVVQIDDFYKDRSNVGIPVTKAVFWVVKRTKGTSTKELADLVVGFRRLWNK